MTNPLRRIIKLLLGTVAQRLNGVPAPLVVVVVVPPAWIVFEVTSVPPLIENASLTCVPGSRAPWLVGDANATWNVRSRATISCSVPSMVSTPCTVLSC